MELHQIRYFLALCEEGNFTRAAKRCGVSQPSLSNAIKRLEEELGGQLFYRNRVGCSLSELGQELRPHLAKLDQCTSDVRECAARFLAEPRASAVTPQQAPLIGRPEQRAGKIWPRLQLATAFRGFETGGTVMRIHHVLAVVAVVLVGVGVKIFFTSPTAEADSPSVKSASLDISQLHRGQNLPVEKFRDMSLVFTGD
jgi:DNA-binding transcriptional LysR family regulator